jgi:hypothetical protein
MRPNPWNSTSQPSHTVKLFKTKCCSSRESDNLALKEELRARMNYSVLPLFIALKSGIQRQQEAIQR